MTAAAVLLIPAAPASAHPQETWRTLETEHFDIHFPDGGYEVALRAAGYLETAHQSLAPLLGHRPRLRTQVVLSDDVDFANGSARVVPYPLVRGYMAPPTVDSLLNHYDDFLWLLLVHEYAHVLHLDNAGGLPEVANRIFGRRMTPNHLAPKWMIEGVATLFESTLSAGGRNDSSLAEMYIRAKVLEDQEIWPIEHLSGAPSSWPGGNLWYLLGGRFWAYLIEHYGEVAGVALPEDYGRRILPFALNSSARKAIGSTLEEIWGEWAEEEAEHHGRVIENLRREGVVEGRRISAIGRRVTSPRWAGNGSKILAYVEAKETAPAIRSFDIEGPIPAEPRETEDVRRAIGASSFALCPQGDMMVIAIRDSYRIEQRYDDLWAADVRGGPLFRLTRGLRARDPALSLDGRRLAFVSRRRGETALYVASIELDTEIPGQPSVRLGRPVRVFHEKGVHLDRPSFSPDGASLVFSGSRTDTGRDLILLDLEGVDLPAPVLSIDERGAVGPPIDPSLSPDIIEESAADEELTGNVVRLTRDSAQDIYPVFDPNGTRVLFSSDRTGVFDLYAVPLDESGSPGKLERLTRTLTGAFEPALSPDGTAVAYVTYTASGYDLALLTLGDSEELEPPPVPRDREPKTPNPGRLYPVRSYSPWASLRPYYWLPFAGVDSEGTTLGLNTGGSDAIGDHSWSTSVWIGTTSRNPGYNAQYSWRGLYPTLGISSSRHQYRTSNSHIRDGVPQRYDERAWRLTGTASLSIPSNERSQSLSLSVAADHRKVLSGVPRPDPGEAVPVLPESGLITRTRLSWSTSSVRRFPESHVPFEGTSFRLGAERASRFLGGDFDYTLVTGSATGHRLLPFGRDNVIAGRLQVGLGHGTPGGRNLFSLGGLSVSDPLELAQNLGAAPSGPILRGFPPFGLSGNAYWVANLEHRFPLLTPERGLGTLPVFLRRVHASAFVDVGAVSLDTAALPDARTLLGVGGEVRLDIILGYQINVDLRLGWARGIGPDAVAAPYFGFGGAF